MDISRRQVLIGAGCAVLATSTPLRAAETIVIAGAAFGTSWRLIMPSGSDAVSAKAALEEIIHSVDVAMSPFRADSEISRFNGAETVDWVSLSPQSCFVIEAALDIAGRSHGAFDPTIGPVVGRYGFGPITNAPAGDYAGIEVRAGAIRKSHAGLSLDLCGIAKGHALDRMTRALDSLGMQNFLIELGGEVFARGRHPEGRHWQVGIERPVPGRLQFLHLVGLEGQALATSGDAANAYDFEGLHYSHIIDPRSGEPVRNGVASVSVCATNGMEADALATTLMVMGTEIGADFAEQENIAALFVVRDGAHLREVITGDFADHIIT